MHFYLSYLGWMSADWKNKCWFTIYNRCFIYDSNIYFGALIWFFAPSPASTYGIEDLPFSIEDVSQFQNRLVILYQSGETQIWYYITFCGALNLGWMSILHTVNRVARTLKSFRVGTCFHTFESDKNQVSCLQL